MNNFIDRVYQPLDTSLVNKPCKDGKAINTRKCSHLWPKYPCYDKLTRICENTDGVQNLDPIDDILYSIGESYVALNNLAQKIFRGIPPHRKLESEEKLIRFFREYGTTLKPVSKPVGSILDTARYIDVDGVVDKISDKLTSSNKTIQRGGQRFNTIVDPINGDRVFLHSKNGKRILKGYLKYLK